MGKDKRRNTEKRKEKSRDAARCRRGKESEIFMELASCLPLPHNLASQLDKASVMRLSLSFLKLQRILESGGSQAGNKENVHQTTPVLSKGDKLAHLYKKALEGFTFILSQEGDIIYMSDSVSKYLGLQQMELVGQSLFDFSHPCDHDEIREMLTPRLTPPALSDTKSFFLRMKCTLTAKGRNVNLKSAVYKVLKCCGHLESVGNPGAGSDVKEGAGSFFYLAGIAELIPHPSNIEVPLDSRTFLSKHNMQMSFVDCDSSIMGLAGYCSQDLIGQSLYVFYHAADSEIIEKAFKTLFAKGQSVTGPCRFLARTGGHVWVVTQATVINDSRTQKPQWVVCVHYVLSDIEEVGTIVSSIQSPTEKTEAKCDLMPLKVELSSETILQPRTKDSAYVLTPDLTSSLPFGTREPHLPALAAPACEENIPLTLSSLVEQDLLLSPVFKQEPEARSPELCFLPDLSSTSRLEEAAGPSETSSPRLDSTSDYLDSVTTVDVDSMNKFFQSIQTSEQEPEVEDIDFDMRAPYIPMDGGQDLGLLPPSSNVLFNLSSDVNPGLFGLTESVFGPQQSLYEDPPPPPKLSVRDMLGGSTAVASIEQPADTMYLQMKRPLDMNSLEKGPPSSKLVRLDPGPVLGPSGVLVSSNSLPSHLVSNKTSGNVLLHLLLQRADQAFSFQLQPSLDTSCQPQVLFPHLGQPQPNNPQGQVTQLLQGQELLLALDTVPLPACSDHC